MDLYNCLNSLLVGKCCMINVARQGSEPSTDQDQWQITQPNYSITGIYLARKRWASSTVTPDYLNLSFTELHAVIIQLRITYPDVSIMLLCLVLFKLQYFQTFWLVTVLKCCWSQQSIEGHCRYF